jgi:RNA polymerase sigma-70 factor (ECF subfamily)
VSQLPIGDDESRSGEIDPHTVFEQQVFPLRARLYRMAWYLTKNNADAEDLVQDTMINAYRSMDSYQPNTHLVAWLLRIMRHRFIDNHRRRQRRPPEHLTDDITDWQGSDHGHHSTPASDIAESCFAVGELTARVRTAVQQLPEDLRSAVYYAYVEGRDCQDIARIQRVPVGTVKSRLYRARRRLRELLAEFVPANYLDEPTVSCVNVDPCGQ